MTNDSNETPEPFEDFEESNSFQEWLTPQRKKILLIGGAVVLFFMSIDLFVGGTPQQNVKQSPESPAEGDMGFSDAKSMTDHKKGDVGAKIAALVEKEAAERAAMVEPDIAVSVGDRVSMVDLSKQNQLDRIEDRVLGDLIVEPESKSEPEAEAAPTPALSKADQKRLKEQKRKELEDRLLTKIKNREGIELSHEELIERLVRGGLGSSDQMRAIEAGMLLRELALPADAENLTRILKKQRLHDEGRKFLIEIIGQLGDRRSYLTLEDEFNNRLSNHHLDVIRALGPLGDERAIPLLVGVIKDDPRKYPMQWKQSAIISLSQIGGSKAEYALTTDVAEDLRLLQTIKWAVAHMKGKVDLNKVHTVMPPGRQHLVLQYKGTEYHLYHPVLRRKNQFRPRLVVCLPDVDLNAQMLMFQCKNIAKDQRVGVLVPVFDPVLYPDYGQFNYRSKDHRADHRLLELLDLIAEHAKVDTREIFMIGMGEGGTFVLNFAMAYPKRVARFIVSQTPNLFVPKDDLLFPDGLKVNPLVPDIEPNLRDFLKTDGLFLGMHGTDEGKLMEKTFDEFFLRSLEEGITPRLYFKSNSLPKGTTEGWDYLVVPYMFPKNTWKSVDDL
jgi:hypothetical protein